jgi:hypothetical protein
MGIPLMLQLIGLAVQYLKKAPVM